MYTVSHKGAKFHDRFQASWQILFQLFPQFVFECNCERIVLKQVHIYPRLLRQWELRSQKITGSFTAHGVYAVV